MVCERQGRNKKWETLAVKERARSVEHESESMSCMTDNGHMMSGTKPLTKQIGERWRHSESLKGTQVLRFHSRCFTSYRFLISSH